MQKFEQAIQFIMEHRESPTNAELAARIGCDEGLIRRARNAAQVRMLQLRIAELEAVITRPRKKKVKGPEFRPLWETPGDDPEPFVPMIGE